MPQHGREEVAEGTDVAEVADARLALFTDPALKNWLARLWKQYPDRTVQVGWGESTAKRDGPFV